MEENEVKNTINEEVKETNENISNVSQENQSQTNQNTGKQVNVCCLISFILSMVGIIAFGIYCGIGAVILGIVGLVTFKPEKHHYKWMGITGLSVGAVEVVVMELYIVFVVMAAAAGTSSYLY